MDVHRVYCPHKPLLLFGLQCPWCFLWQVLAPHVRPSQSKKQVEIVQGGERQINRCGLSFARFLEMALEIPNRVITPVGIAERAAVIVHACCQIGAILSDPPKVGPARVRA